MDDAYIEPMDTASQQGSGEGAKLPPVLANLIGNLNSSSRSPQATSVVSNTAAPTVNVQELLSSIMVNTRQHSCSFTQRSSKKLNVELNVKRLCRRFEFSLCCC